MIRGHRDKVELKLLRRPAILIMAVDACYSSTKTGRFLCPLLILLVCFAPLLSHAAYTISPGESLRDGEELISANEVFELGFFSPGKSTNRYVGIWYHNFSTNTVLWVANRQNPVKDSSGTLTIAADGSLVVLDSSSTILWSSNTSSAFNNDSLLQLMDSGNLVLNHSGATVWQSFDHPCDTYMPGMKVGLDLLTKENQEITSWTSPDDPAPGNYSLSMDPRGSTQIFMWERGKPRWRSGRWNGQVFIGIQNMVAQYIYGFKLNNFVQEGRMYFYYDQFNSSHRYVLSWDGIERHMLWKNDTGEWFQFWAQPQTKCEVYNTCGMNAGCTDEASPICSCLTGFVPAVSEEWESGNWSSGCVRRTALGCTATGDDGGDGFLQLTGVKLPDSSDWYMDVLDSDGCHDRCLRNCSCKAYAYVTGIGCLSWGLDLLDIHIFSSGGNDLFLRLAGDELKNSSNNGIVIIIVVVVASAVIFLLGSLLLLWKCRKRIKNRLLKTTNEERASAYSSFGRDTGGSGSLRFNDESNDAELSELQLWNFDTVLIATKGFSESELIGEGGFGLVYKGVIPGGQEIAVKRLSRSSGQGIEEFKNEVRLISKLQHRNLVKLLGCCIHEQEKILIYEYMPNKSLDALLYDPVKKSLLGWETRYKIIEGIARGLLYLHRDSRLRIIHRDLKASNILLDEEMNPKISDFGMARIFGNYDETATNRVVGTFGYMAPEYAMQGLFSVKSDAYSFGVLVLEIISGRRSSTFLHPELGTSLIATAWKLWNEDRVRELVDPAVLDSCVSKQLQRCVNIGLLCVQDRPVDRPSMASVVVMLESETAAPALPRQPLFTTHRSFSETDSSTIELNAISANASITMLTGR